MFYRTEDRKTRLEVRLVNETVWLSLNQMAELFQRDKSVISRHIKNVFDEGELGPERQLLQNLQQFKPRATARSRARSSTTTSTSSSPSATASSRSRGTQFRIWATQRLREYIVKGFTLDDERLKRAGGGNYFDELLARIRDIRSSEKVFWRKVLDIYATSIDYDPRAEASQLFFATVQNKMHWAAHGHTAAEDRPHPRRRRQAQHGADQLDRGCAEEGRRRHRQELPHEAELDALNRIVTAYLEFAELQALNRKPMYMRDWIAKLDDFLRLSERDILTHAGSVSHEQALAKARQEYEKYEKLHADDVSAVEQHFTEAVKEVKALAKKPRARKRTRK